MENKTIKQIPATLPEIIERFREYNRQHDVTYGGRHPDGVEPITAVIVYKQSSFTKPYTEIQRSYRVNNFSGKRFFDGIYGESIFGECLDGSEDMIRVDLYPWDIERCYFEVAA